MASEQDMVTVHWDSAASHTPTPEDTLTAYSTKVISDHAFEDPLQPEQEVLVLLGASNKPDHNTDLPCHTDRRHIWSTPSQMTSEQAYTHITSLVTARAILHSELSLPLAPDKPGEWNILLMGADTSVGAAAIQILHEALPDAKVFATATGPSQRDLFQRVSHTIQLGCVYAIDGGIEDLVESLRGAVEVDGRPADGVGKRFDVVVGAVEGGLPRRDVLELLKENGKVVDLDAVRVDCGEVLEDLGVDEKMVFERIVDEAATVFGTYVEPPEGCGFSDEQ